MAKPHPPEEASESPESVVKTVIASLEDRQWGEVFRRVDSSDVARWRRTTLSALRQMEHHPQAREVFAGWGAADTVELEALSDGDLFARWLNASSPEARARIAFPAVGAPAPPQVQRVVLGAVAEGDDLTHVIYRETVDRAGSALRIATVRRTESGWRLAIDHNLLTCAAHQFGPVPPGR